MPLEARIEAEPVPVPAERVRAEAGLQLLRRLAGAGLGTLRRHASSSDGGSDEAASSVLAGRVPDAGQIAADLRPLADPGGGPLTGLPGGFGGAHGDARAVFADWLRWYDGYLVPSDGAAWDPHRQEYSFAVQAELPAGTVLFTAQEYTTGRLDWPDFDATLGTLGPTPAGRIGTLRTSRSACPCRPGSPGMPADRLWEFEDARVYLGGIDAGPTDLARMALVEFSLAYGVDWFVLPIDVAAGSVLLGPPARGDRHVRHDGERRLGASRRLVDVRPRHPGEQTFVANVLVVPPVVPHVLESEPLEEVALFRDEMANLVWGVERVVQDAAGRPVDRARQVAAVSLRQTVPGDLGDAAIVYRLMTPVPDHWVAVRRRAGTRRRRRARAPAAAPLPRRRHHRRDPSHSACSSTKAAAGCASPRKRCRATAPSSPAATNSPAPPTAARRSGSAAASASATAKAGAASGSTPPRHRDRCDVAAQVHVGAPAR